MGILRTVLQGRETVTRKHTNFFRIVNALLFYLSGLARRNEKRILFGSWLGYKYADNPKYFFEYLIENHKDYELIWCGRECVRDQIPKRDNVKFVESGTFRSFYYLLTSKFCFIDHGFKDVGCFNLTRGATRVNLGHGLAIKRMGAKGSVLRNPLLLQLRRILREPESYHYFVTSSTDYGAKMLEEFAVNKIRKEKTLLTGQPRVDFLIQGDKEGRISQIRQNYYRHYGIPLDKRIIAYMPTFRDHREEIFSFTQLSGDELRAFSALLEKHNAVVLEKKHFVDGTVRKNHHGGENARVFDLGAYTDIDTQELLLVTDILVTDYSGCYLDYLVLDRPIIHFAYDYDYYAKKDRGLYYDLADVAGGEIVQTKEDLYRSLEASLNDKDAQRERRHKVRENLLTYEKGNSCKAIFRLVLRPLEKESGQVPTLNHQQSVSSG